MKLFTSTRVEEITFTPAQLTSSPVDLALLIWSYDGTARHAETHHYLEISGLRIRGA